MRRFLARFAACVRVRGREERLQQEIEEHLALQTAENLRFGLPPDEARRQAMLKFGAVEAIKEEYRDGRGLPFIESVPRDTRHAIRQLRKSPAFAVTAIVTLALGIGANASIFSVINSVILRPLPFADSDRLLSVRSLYTRYEPYPTELSYPNFFDLRAYNHVFEHLVSYRGSEFTLQTPDQPLHLEGEIVSWDLFPLLRVPLVRGRGFLPQEETRGTNVVVLGYSIWQSAFAGDPGLAGRSITINGKPFTVVGIAPQGFRYPIENPDVQLWTTIAQDAMAPADFHPVTIQRGARMINAIGRLKAGVSLEQARSQMDAIAANLARQYPDENKNVAHTSIRPELEELTGSTREPLLILMGAVGLLLLIACLNVANLLLARTSERAREFALRAAIGASRAVIVAQLLTESLLLSFFGAITGIVLALLTVRLVVRLAGAAIPRLDSTRIDSTVLAFCIGLALMTSVLFSLAPMTRIRKMELVEFVKEGTHGIARGRDRLRSALIVAQLALSLVLLSGASLLVTTFLKLERRDPGFRTDHLLKFEVSLPEAQYTVPKQIVFDDRILERLRMIPGVESAASGWPFPFEGDQVAISFDIQERPAPPSERPNADMAIVAPGFFHTLGIPLLRGRAFGQRDDLNAPPVVIVNQAFAQRFFPGEDAVGKQIRSGATFGNKGPVVETIVGIVGNAKQFALRSDPEPIYYFPYKQLPWGMGAFVMRTSVPPRSIEPAVRAVVASLDPQAPVYKVVTMEDSFSAAIDLPRLPMWLLGSFAGIALLLAMVGLYGVMAYSVSKRTREIGIRIAVGANRSAIVQMVFQQAAVLLVIGIGLGVAASRLTDRLLERMPFVVPLDTRWIVAVASLTMALTGAIAAYLPARRAACTDPVQALRVE